MQTACGIADNNITAACLRRRDRIEHDRRRIAALGMAHKLRIGALCPDLKLVDRRRTEGIRCRDQNALALILELMTHLADRCRLAGAVDADHKDHGGLCRKIQSLVLAHHFCGDLLDQPHDIIRIGDAALLDAVTQLVADLDRRVSAHIAHDHRFLKLLKELLVDFRKRSEHPAQPAHQAVACLFQTVTDLLKNAHADSPYFSGFCSVSGAGSPRILFGLIHASPSSTSYSSPSSARTISSRRSPVR